MTTDDPALQERIARVLHGFEWDCAHDGSDGEWALSEAKPYYLSLAAAVLPIIAAEVRAASEKAWDDGESSGLTEAAGGHGWPNPYRATETGGRA